MTDERLIENRIWKLLAESIQGEKEGTTIPVPVEDIRRLIDAREKAHTPTDDEREARLEYVIDAAVPVDEFPSWRFRYSRRIADAVRASGYAQEPQGEPSDFARMAEAWGAYYRPGMSQVESRAFKAGWRAASEAGGKGR